MGRFYITRILPKKRTVQTTVNTDCLMGIDPCITDSDEGFVAGKGTILSMIDGSFWYAEQDYEEVDARWAAADP